MKRLISTIVLFLSLCMGVMAQNDAIYVYRNDGEFNAFLKAEVDSMCYSHFDADSLYHNEWQMQLIYTADSLYQIPLEVIDSISFRAPEARINRDVFVLTPEHDPYLSGCDTVRFTLALNTPSHLIPSKGNIVVSRYDCMSFPDGIMARVLSKTKDASGFHFECERVGIESVFDQLVVVGYGYADIDEPSTRGEGKERQPVSVTKILWDKQWEKTLSTSGTTTKFDCKDKAYVKFTANLQPNQPAYFSAELTNELKTLVDFNAKSSFSKYYGLPLVRDLVFGRIPVPGAYGLLSITPKFSLTAYFEESNTVSLDFKAHYNRSDKLIYKWQDGAWDVSYAPKQDVAIDVASLSMQGSVEVGVIPDILLAINGSSTGIGVEYMAGIKETIDFKFDALAAFDTGMYDALKDSYVKTTIPQEFHVYARASLLGIGTAAVSKKVSFEPQWGSTKYLLPLFSTPQYQPNKVPGRATLTSQVSRDLLLPVKVGMAYYDESGIQDLQYVASDYRSEKGWPKDGLRANFTNLLSGKTYTAYPVVKILGKELRATPSANFQIVDVDFPQIENFKQTNASYSKGGFYNDGRSYDYKYEVAVTVKANTLDGIEDWGYAYKDPYGEVSRISLMQFGASYTDTRYAYYRNEAKSSVCLYTYVKYTDDSEYYYDDPHDYPLNYGPDNHEYVDLGLSVKWATCNVGASSPEDYGDYFAWGETEPKDDYRWSNYKYLNDSDFSLTKYCTDSTSGIVDSKTTLEPEDDAATVNWGSPWRMPTREEQDELREKCTWTWTTQGGVNGYSVKGPNGNTIFLPAAGSHDDKYLLSVGSGGYYWSSSLHTSVPDDAYYLSFYSSDFYWFDYFRCYGHSVRPVCQ